METQSTSLQRFLASWSPSTATGRLNILLGVLIFVALSAAAAWIGGVYVLLNNPAYGGQAVDIDFSVFWAAARLAAEQGWLAPFDSQVLNSARSLPPERTTYEMLWLYPPGFMAAIYPLGGLSFFWAWIVFISLALVSFAIALWVPTRGVPGGMVFLLCAPVTMFLLMLGQNSLFFCALLLGAIEAIRRDRAVLAGLLIALMTLKPQLGAAIPIALAAGAYWRVIGWATLFTAVIVAITMVFPGPDYWLAFIQAIREGAEKIQGDNLEALMISVYGNGVIHGLPVSTALTLQTAVSVAVAMGLAWVWFSRSVGFDLKAAALCFAILLMTPYAIYYELVFAAVGGLYLVRTGLGMELSGRLVLVMLWILPITGYLMTPTPGYGFTSIFLLFAFGLCLYRALRLTATGRTPAQAGA